MTISLRIDNCDALPDGGPLSYGSTNRGFDFGRDSHLDWTLPDESRYISGRHCEIRYEQNCYWLYDISRNGTFLNGSQDRVKSPHQLQDGDKISVGHYIIVVSVEGGDVQQFVEDDHGAAEQNYASASDDIWSVQGDVPDPINRRDLMPPKEQGQRAPDFSEQYLDMPEMRPDTGFQSAAGGIDPFTGEPLKPVPAAPPAAAPPPQAAPIAPAVPVPPSAPAISPVPVSPVPYQDPSPLSTPEAVTDPNLFKAQEVSQPFVPTPAAPPVEAAAPAPPQAGVAPADADLFQYIAAGAGVPASVFTSTNPAEMAQEIGAVLRVVVEHMAQLLKARAAAKTMAKSSNRTMISAMNNNPLKFVPTTEEMFDVMFAGRKAGYLGAKDSLADGFEDLKAHEFATYAAMQKALALFLEEFSPDHIEGKLPSSAFSSKSTKAWEAYVARWDAMSETHENGALDVFLSHFAVAYDEASKSKKNKS